MKQPSFYLFLFSFCFFCSFFLAADMDAQKSASLPDKLAPVQVGMRYGLKDMQGKTVIPALFEALIPDGDSCRARTHGKWGLVNLRGEWVVQPLFEALDKFYGRFAVAARKDSVAVPKTYYLQQQTNLDLKYGLIGQDGAWVIKPLYEKLVLCTNGTVILYKKFNLWGVMTVDGKKQTLPVYEAIFPFTDGAAVVVYKDPSEISMLSAYYGSPDETVTGGKWGVIDQQGKELIAPHYAYIGSFHDGLAAFNEGGTWGAIQRYGSTKALRNGKWGFLDVQGRIVIPATYESVNEFDEGVALVTKEGSTYLIDKVGHKLARPDSGILKRVGVPALTTFCQAPAWGFIDTAGRMVIAAAYGNARPFQNGLAAVSQSTPCDRQTDLSAGTASNSLIRNSGVHNVRVNEGEEQWGYIDASGTLVIPYQFTRCVDFSDGLAAVFKEGSWGFINKKGEWVISPRYDDDTQCHYRFKDGLALVSIQGKWGFVDHAGKQVIPLVYTLADEFEEGLAAVRIGDSWGFIDRQGQMVIKPQFNVVGSFKEGLANVRKRQSVYSSNTSTDTDFLYGYIHKNGNWAVPPAYTDARDFNEGMAAVAGMKNGSLQWGYINASGSLVIAEKYQAVKPFEKGIAYVCTQTQGNYIDHSGNNLTTPVDVAYGYEGSKYKLINGFTAAIDPANLWGFKDKHFNWVIKPEYEQVSHFTRINGHE